MNLQKNQIKNSEIELIIEISQAECQPFLEKAALQISQTNKIEGFRPGHAPYEIIKQRVGEMAIYNQALNNIVSHFYFKAVTKEKLNTIAQPKIEIEKLAPSNPIIFKAAVALMPKVKLGHYKNIKIEKKEFKAEDSEVDKVINDLRKTQAKEILVDRAAKAGDRVEVNFEVSLNKVVIEGGSGQKYPLVLGEGAMIPGFEEQLVGLKKDQERQFQLKFPEQYQNKMVAGKLCDFKVKLLSVYQRDLPELTDEWAKGLGSSNVSDLKSKIHNNLLEEQKFHEEQRQEIEMLNKIVAATEFSEIPEVLIESEAHRMIHEFEHSITGQGIGFSDYLQGLKKTEAELMADFNPKALERVKTSLVIKEIAEAEKIEVAPQDLQAETLKILEQVKGNKEAEDNIKSEGYQHYLATVLRNRQVIEMLKNNG